MPDRHRIAYGQNTQPNSKPLLTLELRSHRRSQSSRLTSRTAPRNLVDFPIHDRVSNVVHPPALLHSACRPVKSKYSAESQTETPQNVMTPVGTALQSLPTTNGPFFSSSIDPSVRCSIGGFTWHEGARDERRLHPLQYILLACTVSVPGSVPT